MLIIIILFSYYHKLSNFYNFSSSQKLSNSLIFTARPSLTDISAAVAGGGLIAASSLATVEQVIEITHNNSSLGGIEEKERNENKKTSCFNH